MGKGSDGGYALRSGATRYGKWHRRRAAGLRHERCSEQGAGFPAAEQGPAAREAPRSAASWEWAVRGSTLFCTR